MLHRHYLEPKVGDDPTTYCLLSNCSANVSYSGTAEMKALSSLDFPTELRRLHRTGISCLCFEPLASALELSYSLAAWMVPMSGFEPLTSSPWMMRLCHLGYIGWLLLLGSNQLSLGQSQVHCQLCEGTVFDKFTEPSVDELYIDIATSTLRSRTFLSENRTLVHNVIVLSFNGCPGWNWTTDNLGISEVR